MKITRLFTGKDNQSHFEEVEISLFNTTAGKITTPTPVESIIFGLIEDDSEVTWYNPPCRQYVIMLQGAMEIEVGDGSRQIFHEGHVLLTEDTSGQGHITRPASSGTRKYLAIPF